MGIQNGPAPEGSVIGGNKEFWARECNRLKALLQESEQLRQDAFQACEAMRLELAAVTQELTTVTLERDEWKAAVEYQQQQATQLRQQVEALEAALDDVQGINKTIAGQLADADAQIRQFEKINDTRDELEHKNKELRAQLDAAAVTPAQQPDGNAAERLEAVRRLIGEIWGWYACVECLGEQSAETWEQVGALLGHLQREAG